MVYSWTDKHVFWSARPKVLSPTTTWAIISKLYRKFGSSVRKTARILNVTQRNRKNKKLFLKALFRNTWKRQHGVTKPTGVVKHQFEQKRSSKVWRNGREKLVFDIREKLRANILLTDERWIEPPGQSKSHNRRYRKEEMNDTPTKMNPNHDLKIMVAVVFCRHEATFHTKGSKRQSCVLSKKCCPH